MSAHSNSSPTLFHLSQTVFRDSPRWEFRMKILIKSDFLPFHLYPRPMEIHAGVHFTQQSDYQLNKFKKNENKDIEVSY